MRTRHDNRSKYAWWPAFGALALVIYILSSGPVLALAFWLREATGWDEFYLVMWAYYPLFAVGLDSPLGWYVEWWVVDVFGTVGPG